jgi:CheY-like chemotaxis protein
MQHASMPTKDMNLHILLVADSQSRAETLSQQLRRSGSAGKVSIMPAATWARRAPHRKRQADDSQAFDFVIVDFSDPGELCLAAVSKLAFGQHRIDTPVVLLTSEYSERLLEAGTLDCRGSVMFAPTNLPSFLKKMRQISRSRFLRALSIIWGIGPVLVSLPGYLARSDDNMSMPNVA